MQRIENKVETGQEEILERLQQSSEWVAGQFARQWNWEMAKIEAECPNTFFLTPVSKGIFNPKDWVSEPYNLHLMCQHPAGPHGCGDPYVVRQSEHWWATMAPWLDHLVRFLKFGVPLGRALAAIHDDQAGTKMKNQITLLEEMVKNAPKPTDVITSPAALDASLSDQSMTGPALRALYTFLKQEDKSRKWGGLHRIPTPDGNILWLCEEHRQQFEARRLIVSI